MIEIAPSILSADFSRLGEQIKIVEQAGASLLHVDVMDGSFVPNITIGLPVVKAISRATQLPIDAHLMIVEPARYVESFEKAGGEMVLITIEADRSARACNAAGPARSGRPRRDRNQSGNVAVNSGRSDKVCRFCFGNVRESGLRRSGIYRRITRQSPASAQDAGRERFENAYRDRWWHR